MKYLILSIALLMLATSPLSAETISRIAAIVNQDIITTAQLDREIDKMLSAEAQETGITPVQREELRHKMLDKLIEDTLLNQRIEKLGLHVSDEAVEQAINDVQAQNNITREQLKQALVAQGINFDDYRERLRQQLLNFQLIGREIQSKVEVTNTEMRDYYRSHLDDYRNDPYLRLSRITFRLPPGNTPADIAAMRAKAADALQQLRRGKDFLEVLMQNAATSGVDGGDMGKITEGSLSESFNRAISGLSVGQVSEIIETPEGFHLLRLDERNPGDTQTFETVKEQISRKLMEDKRAAALTEWTENLRKEADIEKRL
ncbi:peptidylprolyl cis-trans isomerase, PpiC-type, SurA family [Syntrophotalea carbinolica DSM 2380]|uniref:Peptidylprolyl cis-trans isomerase, PpiC-type, SurA family n=1 Tax=Syntrophotalea carbinolica (strain DSM 2380 / NBRC 103641 / GraBd1) TaxID=338963 RepID=Q3A8E0_SYNC1|nr:SurA N-terminal domain-containing protein [Syntrophotalea carbinolica]ABA87352.1 peptidylprolyl cis-trans isomerase, PpiC-type, SurA family [Syntrophotalea carbinolica DSM 2380]